MFRAPLRSLSTSTRKTLKIGLIPADGIGKEVIPVCFNLTSYSTDTSIWLYYRLLNKRSLPLGLISQNPSSLTSSLDGNASLALELPSLRKPSSKDTGYAGRSCLILAAASSKMNVTVRSLALSGAWTSAYTVLTIIQTFSTAPLRGRSLDIRRQLSHYAKSWTYTPTSDQLSPYVALMNSPAINLICIKVAPEVGQQPSVDLIVVRENTECLVSNIN